MLHSKATEIHTLQRVPYLQCEYFGQGLGCLSAPIATFNFVTIGAPPPPPQTLSKTFGTLTFLTNINGYFYL